MSLFESKAIVLFKCLSLKSSEDQSCQRWWFPHKGSARINFTFPAFIVCADYYLEWFLLLLTCRSSSVAVLGG